MPAQLEEITGIFVSERIRFDSGTAIAEIAQYQPDDIAANGRPKRAPQYFTIKGEFEAGDLKMQMSYRFYGRWSEYTNKRTKAVEKQFNFQTFVRCVPHGRMGIVNYLKAAPHVGLKTAEKLWEKFQGDAVRILRTSPDVAVAAVNAPHFTLPKAKEAAEYLADEQAMEGCTIDLIDALAGRGFPKATARAAVAKWGNTAAAVIKRCPYKLMAFRGCGFLKTDAMYLDRGLDPKWIGRQSLCAWHFLATEQSGDTWQAVARVERALAEKVGGTNIDAPRALLWARRMKMIATRRDDLGNLWLAEEKDAVAERRVAEFVALAAQEKHHWPDVSELAGVSDHQRSELVKALTTPTSTIAVLGGAPGTGKTYTAAAIIKAIVEEFGSQAVGIAAPTGKAAVRVTENLQRYGLDLRARTIHSLLGVKKNDSTDGWSFQHNQNNPLPFLFLIVDESSMIDNSIMASLLAARAVGCCILFVGDINQLPPVGRGAPLRDMITAGVPTGTLTEIRRNSGAIVRACHAIKDGRAFETSARIDLDAEDPANLYLIQSGGAQHQIDRMFAGIDAGKADGLNPIWDCQVLVGVNAKSELGRKALNVKLQERLNPGGEQAVGNPFRVGDKIVNLKNGFVEVDGLDGGESDPNDVEEPETDDDGKVYVANGELAEVLRVEEKLTVARLSNPTRIVKIPRGVGNSGDDDGKGNGNGSGKESDDASSTGCTWDLGYALTCHKSQGSEWPLVLVMLDEYPGARMLCSREWLYTAISRAKRLCLLVGKMGTAAGFCRKRALGLRKTFLVEEINSEMKLMKEIIGV